MIRNIGLLIFILSLFNSCKYMEQAPADITHQGKVIQPRNLNSRRVFTPSNSHTYSNNTITKPSHINNIQKSNQLSNNKKITTTSPTRQKQNTLQHAHSQKPYIWPVKGKIVGKFGKQSDGTKNDGIYIAAPYGTAIHSISKGKVVYAGNEIKEFGNMVIIEHEDSLYSSYAHQSKVTVNKGDFIQKGDIIGYVGNSGHIPSSQLFLSLRKNNSIINPTDLLK